MVTVKSLDMILVVVIMAKHLNAKDDLITLRASFKERTMATVRLLDLVLMKMLIDQTKSQKVKTKIV